MATSKGRKKRKKTKSKKMPYWKKGIYITIIIAVSIFFIDQYLSVQRAEDEYQRDKELLNKVNQISVQLNESDIAKIERIIFEETGFTY